MKNITWLAALVILGGCDSATQDINKSQLAGLTPPTTQIIDQVVEQMMIDTGAHGFALAIIDDGEISHIAAYGDRNKDGAALETDSIMYGASLTKAAFAYTVLQMADEGLVDLDKSIADYLPSPLPQYTEPDIEDAYARWSDLDGDNRWQQLTARKLLTHTSGFANFGFLEPDGILRFHFEPGARYAYSGEGYILLQFVLEKGLGLDVGTEMQARLFEPLGMKDTSLIWREDYADRVADGWTISGDAVPHDERSRVRAAGSMDTTINDVALLAAAIARGDLLTAGTRAEFSRPQLSIKSASQFPTLQQDADTALQHKSLAAGLGVVVTEGPQGRVIFKGGHDDITGNTLVCIEKTRRCVVVLGNDLRAESAIPYLVEFILGPTGVPWRWEYGDRELWTPPAGL